MPVKTGLDVLEETNFKKLLRKNIAILCNQASVNNRLKNIIDLILAFHHKGHLSIKAVFGPQHGLWGYTQDNMIEWEGEEDRRTGLNIYSLYGKNRKPTSKMLKEIDLLVIDLQDVGSRYYTFIWTMALCMEKCNELGIEVLVLDRPNPISGSKVEGSVLIPEFSSFVGLYPLPLRHGMTIAEISLYLQKEYFKSINLDIIKMYDWQRKMYFPETGLTWILPSPNMPIWETSLVYPGMCLLEGTNLSEGRGTTRPFEVFGAPWIDSRELSDHLNNSNLPGVYFRPFQFLPTFQKYSGEICEGCFIHVLDYEKYKSVLTAVTILQTVKENYPEKFLWKQPPYEYEYKKLPIDILAGSSWLRKDIENLNSLLKIEKQFQQETEAFEKVRQKFLMY